MVAVHTSILFLYCHCYSALFLINSSFQNANSGFQNICYLWGCFKLLLLEVFNKGSRDCSANCFVFVFCLFFYLVTSLAGSRLTLKGSRYRQDIGHVKGWVMSGLLYFLCIQLFHTMVYAVAWYVPALCSSRIT